MTARADLSQIGASQRAHQSLLRHFRLRLHCSQGRGISPYPSCSLPQAILQDETHRQPDAAMGMKIQRVRCSLSISHHHVHVHSQPKPTRTSPLVAFPQTDMLFQHPSCSYTRSRAYDLSKSLLPKSQTKAYALIDNMCSSSLPPATLTVLPSTSPSRAISNSACSTPRSTSPGASSPSPRLKPKRIIPSPCP